MQAEAPFTLGRFLEKRLSRLFTLFIVWQHLFVLHARNRLDECAINGNTRSLVSVGRGLMQDNIKSCALLTNLADLLFTPGKRQVRCGTVFKVHTLATGFESCRFHRISVKQTA